MQCAMKTLGIAAIALLVSREAWADPCMAPLPSRGGTSFSGVVRYVGDGDSLCVGPGADPSTWIEVRLGDFDAPELHSPEGPRSKAILEGLTLGHEARCTAVRGRRGRVIVFDRVIAVCRTEGQSIGDRLRLAGAPSGGN